MKGPKSDQINPNHGCNFTDKGAHEIKDTYSEGSDEIAMTSFTLNTIKAGNIRMQTLRAFTAGEMAKILEKVA